MNPVEPIVRAVESTGIAIIVAGSFGSLAVFAVRAARQGFHTRIYDAFRSALGRSILLGLEFLVAAGTVAIEPTLDSLAVLAGIVLIRTFLSLSLEVEIEGRWPWRGAAAPPPGPPQ